MNRGTILHVCISPRKGMPKEAVQQAVLVEDHGLKGDAHAGAGHRQVSLLSEADIEAMKAKGLSLKPGAFGENLVVRGIDLTALGVGSQLRAGDAEIELTQIDLRPGRDLGAARSFGLPRDEGVDRSDVVSQQRQFGVQRAFQNDLGCCRIQGGGRLRTDGVQSVADRAGIATPARTPRAR